MDISDKLGPERNGRFYNLFGQLVRHPTATLAAC